MTAPDRAMAVVFAAPGRVKLSEIRVPHLRSDKVKVQTELTGIGVGTDRWMIEGKYCGVSERYPFVYGYQHVGRFVAIGPAVPRDAGLAAGGDVERHRRAIAPSYIHRPKHLVRHSSGLISRFYQ